jgi:two-component system sensor histidine kinase KdpD
MQRIGLIGARPRVGAGIVAAVVAVALTTALIYPLLEVAPAVSTGVTYLVAVLVVSVVWGLWLGLFTAVLSAASFNWFHIPPTGRFTIAEGENWVALAVFFVAAAIASSVAELARARAADADRRRREAALSAELARLLLADAAPERALAEVNTRLADAIGLESAEVALGAEPSAAGRLAIPLGDDGAPIATLLVPDSIDAGRHEQLESRVGPALATLIAAALERHRLGIEAVEAGALRRSDELKTALLRSVSHDLRTPLTAIVAAGDALASPAITDGERAELTEVVRQDATRLSRLVDQLLDLSRLESGAAPPRREWSSVEEIVAAAIEQTGDSRIVTDYEPGLPLVNADAAQLERALVNVLENAIRHAGDDRVTVHARTVGSRLIVRVVDRGGGVPAADLERIFEPFYRGAAARLEGGGGSGLGLAIARGFVVANGGAIRAESLPSQGTAIVIELPVEPQPAGAAGGVGSG